MHSLQSHENTTGHSQHVQHPIVTSSAPSPIMRANCRELIPRRPVELRSGCSFCSSFAFFSSSSSSSSSSSLVRYKQTETKHRQPVVAFLEHISLNQVSWQKANTPSICLGNPCRGETVHLYHTKRADHRHEPKLKKEQQQPRLLKRRGLRGLTFVSVWLNLMPVHG